MQTVTKPRYLVQFLSFLKKIRTWPSSDTISRYFKRSILYGVIPKTVEKKLSTRV